MDFITVFLITCVCYLFVWIYPDLRGWAIIVWETVSGYLYDLGADLEGVEEFKDEEDK